MSDRTPEQRKLLWELRRRSKGSMTDALKAMEANEWDIEKALKWLETSADPQWNLPKDPVEPQAIQQQNPIVSPIASIPVRKDQEIPLQPDDPDGLRLGFTAIEGMGVTVFSMKSVEYLNGPPAWHRRLYWWWQDKKHDFAVWWCHAFHQDSHKDEIKTESGKVIGQRCLKCECFMWRQL